jgi:hypothetical protein
MSPDQKQVLVDAGVFAVKMLIDGIKDITIGFVGLAAAVVDFIRGKQHDGFLFHKVMRLGERIDDALDLYNKRRLPPDEIVETRRSDREPR